MTKKPCALVDSCVLLDIFNNDKNWSDWSVTTLFNYSKTHTLSINLIIFTEIAFNFDNCEQLSTELSKLGIQLLEIPLAAAFHVSQTFVIYRRNKGSKSSPMPDFYIGAHAHALAAPLITRDVARFKTYFPELILVHPNGAV